MRRGNGGMIGSLNAPAASSARGVWSLSEAQQFNQNAQWPSGGNLVEFLIVGGGAAANPAEYPNGASGGGGAGGVLTGTMPLLSGVNYNVRVGAGGAYSSSIPSPGTSSFVGTLYAFGGGISNSPIGTRMAGDGGSGGGTSYSASYPVGRGTPGQGFNGGVENAGYGGGGGGASQTGQASGKGGNGIQSSITGTATYYGGGGSGGLNSNSGGGQTGGLGGGGTGGASYGGAGGAGTANTGGGGGGGGAYAYSMGAGAAGGSGIIVIAYPNTLPDLTISAGLTYTKDTTSRSGYKIFKITAGFGTISW